MATTTISTKGRVILPKVIRDQLRWDTGTRLTMEQTADGVFLKQLTSTFAPTPPEDVFGCLPYAGKQKSIEEMGPDIVLEARRRYVQAAESIASSGDVHPQPTG